MDAEEQYLFDLMGFLVVKQVLSRAEVDELNDLLDGHDLWRKAESGQESAWRNDPNFMTVGALHTWEEPFRRLLAHPRMLPYLTSLVGQKFRYDHGYALLMRPGSKQLGLHGGNTPWDPAQDYHYRDGVMMNGLIVMSYALTDAGADDGGFAVVPGSHKANFAVPKRYISLEETGPWAARVPVQAGDVIIFSEACTHGTWPWRAQHERRSLLYKFCPGHMAWASPYPTPADAPEIDYPEQLKRILDAPYVAPEQDVFGADYRKNVVGD
jgi:ectoine hydroxylase-related dioxygenase (phytanoyl-CoA dioxygenase family)